MAFHGVMTVSKGCGIRHVYIYICIYIYIMDSGSRDSAVGIATGYGLDGREVGVRVPVGARFAPLHVVPTGSGAHPASYPMGTGALFPGREADHLLQLVPRSIIRGSIHPLPRTSSWRGA
jgi:hypothetical protein